jgi:hypothetical protein
MGESLLNREFRENDLQRVRNLIKKQSDNSTIISAGYNRKEEHHIEGDTWIENDKTWTIKNGIKQNTTKMDRAKKSVVLPMFCPKCGRVMKNRNDKDFYPVHGMCFDCVIEFETELKRTGKFAEYEKQIQNQELTKHVEDFKIFIEDMVNDSGQTFTEDGKLEKWTGNLDKDKVNQYLKDIDNYLETQLKK